jgi:hypothetical protein
LSEFTNINKNLLAYKINDRSIVDIDNHTVNVTTDLFIGDKKDGVFKIINGFVYVNIQTLKRKLFLEFWNW